MCMGSVCVGGPASNIYLFSQLLLQAVLLNNIGPYLPNSIMCLNPSQWWGWIVGPSLPKGYHLNNVQEYVVKARRHKE